jgi:hypothetical protein
MFTLLPLEQLNFKMVDWARICSQILAAKCLQAGFAAVKQAFQAKNALDDCWRDLPAVKQQS